MPNKKLWFLCIFLFFGVYIHLKQEDTSTTFPSAEFVSSENHEPDIFLLDQEDTRLISYIKNFEIKKPSDKPYKLRRYVYDYSQHHLGKYIHDIFKDKVNGTFIEVGAYDGEMFSNTLHLERKLGWRGLLIEPDPINYDQLLKKSRKSHTVNCCLSLVKRPQRVKFRQRRNVGRIIEEGSNKEVKGNTVKVTCYPFYSLMVANNLTTLDLLSLDVEGNEMQMVPIFVLLFIMEDIYFYWRKRKFFRLNDGMTSVALGTMMDTAKLVTNGIELVAYEWLYDKRFIDLDWQSPLTWWAAMIGVDFCYYWFHRSTHEINLFWATHQVHHSSEEYNLTTALRQSFLQHLCSLGFYQPLALLGVPLPALLVHLQFSLFSQFWIHTQMVPKLGPLEWIFNTASHHRVHHGINKWCLDKNYGAFLIVWDRLFGTFQEEKEDEKIVFGLVTQPPKMEPIYLQLFYLKNVLAKAASMETWGETFKALFYGPGWTPGAPRLGDEDAIPDETPVRPKYDPRIPVWTQAYLFSHFVIVILVQQMITLKFATFNWFTAISFICFIFFTLFTIGSAWEGKWWVSILEAARCLATVLILRNHSFTQIPLVDFFFSGYLFISTFIWSLQCLVLATGSKKKVT